MKNAATARRRAECDTGLRPVPASYWMFQRRAVSSVGQAKTLSQPNGPTVISAGVAKLMERGAPQAEMRLAQADWRRPS